MFAPNTRICVTTTPLDPVTAFSMCNTAQISQNTTVLDPFCGSCSTLLAATYLAGIGLKDQKDNNCQTVGIELAEEKYVNFDNVRKDFKRRNLKPPAALLRGDCRDFEKRKQARDAIGGQSFDVIVADPPYGIREAMELAEGDFPPLDELVENMAKDLELGVPLLKSGGRMVVFVPVMEGEDLWSKLPDQDLLEKAGLKIADAKEQFLNSILSRWMVVFTCKY